MSEIAVIGAGGHAHVVLATFTAAGWEIAGVYDDDERLRGSRILGATVVGSPDDIEPGTATVAAVGDNRVRRSLVERWPHLEWASAVHPAATVHDSVAIGAGSVVFAGAVVQPEARIGRHAVVNTAASVDHECLVGNYAQVGPGSHLGGRVSLGEGALVGIGAAVLQGLVVGDWATVGAGAVVTRPVGGGTTVSGVPARPDITR